MKSQRNILIAFILNLTFSVLEFVGGIFTGSVAILSDAIHDFGDAASIGISWAMEKKSGKQPDEVYTYGYGRFSVLGSAITTLTVLVGSLVVIYQAILRIIRPVDIDYNGMILLAVVGVCVNLGAALVTRKGSSLNQKAVNLHMLEDCLGWVIVLVGAVVMRFTDFWILDPVLSIGVAVFVSIQAIRNLRETVDVFLEKRPAGLEVQQIKEDLMALPGVLDVHHIHLWSMDGLHHYATMHIVTDGEAHAVKDAVRAQMKACGITHVTLELETAGEHCHLRQCRIESTAHTGCCHHHHH